MLKFRILILILFSPVASIAQIWGPGFWQTEIARRNQILDSIDSPISMLLRPIYLGRQDSIGLKVDPSIITEKLEISIAPTFITTKLLTDRPYGWADYGMIPNPGVQFYTSSGVDLKFKFLHLQFMPTIVFAQNKRFETSLDDFTKEELLDRYEGWNYGDFPERFASKLYMNFWWGQTKLTAKYGAFEIGGSTGNIWWGPGQFNSLIFSNSSEGFPHLTLNTTKPAKTFLGNFETQLIVGKLTNSFKNPSQFPQLDDRYFRPFNGDWRYLNALMVSYNPKWVPGLFLGLTRTFHQYSESMESGFMAYFPVLEPVTKSNYGFDRDENGQSQQLSIFGRWVFPKAKNEIYFEFGRRDHSFNWREFVLNPEHARAYILGFVQLFDQPYGDKLIQIRGEITHQQESVNRYIRYQGLDGGLTWHTHTRARGFAQKGQPLGVGIGTGSNIQTLEISLVDGVDKMGLLFERLANNQDFYYKAQLQDTERKPWIDLSLGFLYDKKFDNLLVSSKLQIIHARNYQWQLDPSSTPDFPKGENLTSILAQVSLIYFWNKDRQ
jgi:hypothetical protein